MVTELHIKNSYTTVKNASDQTIKILNSKLSFKVAGRFYSEAYQNFLHGKTNGRKWDGRTKLLKYSKSKGYHFPSGLLDIVKAKLDDEQEPYVVHYQTRRNTEQIVYQWNTDIKLRDYQKTAVKNVCKQAGGILKMPIRSGKTKTSAGIIFLLKSKTLFIVPSQLLLYQTKKSLEECLVEEIGLIGDGVWDERNVTVATVQTLSQARGRKDEQYKKLLTSYDLVIFDECHHVRDNSWKEIFLEVDSAQKIGLSATVFLQNDKERERGILWLRAACGPVAFSMEMSELIKMGHLMRPEIRLYTIDQPDLTSKKWSPNLPKEGIYENEYRNNKIYEIARGLVDQGFLVLIVANRTAHIRALQDTFEKRQLDTFKIIGDTKRDDRQDIIDRFVKREKSVLISTVFGEGIDVPEIDCVINAEGGNDIKTTIQKMRNLTPAKGKTEAIYIDFVDLTSRYFAEHSKTRIDVYRSEPLFDIKVIAE